MAQAKCVHSRQPKAKSTQTLLGWKTGCGLCGVRKGICIFVYSFDDFKQILTFRAKYWPNTDLFWKTGHYNDSSSLIMTKVVTLVKCVSRTVMCLLQSPTRFIYIDLFKIIKPTILFSIVGGKKLTIELNSKLWCLQVKTFQKRKISIHFFHSSTFIMYIVSKKHEHTFRFIVKQCIDSTF